jgi:DNA-binding NarL/FixJ family response regulator
MIKVCLVDDHVLLRNALAVLIDKSGSCQVIMQASNGKELIDMFSNNIKPDVILLDMNMPIMDGYQTSIWLKNNYPEIKVLMLTMYDSEIALIRLLQSGVVGFMKKDSIILQIQVVNLQDSFETLTIQVFYCKK